jgi:hypothetical protein
MAVIEPMAIRYGLVPAELWTMTPAEMISVISGRRRMQTDDQEFFDLLNAKACANAFSITVPGSKPKPSEFMVTIQRGKQHHG